MLSASLSLVAVGLAVRQLPERRAAECRFEPVLVQRLDVFEGLDSLFRVDQRQMPSQRIGRQFHRHAVVVGVELLQHLGCDRRRINLRRPALFDAFPERLQVGQGRFDKGVVPLNVSPHEPLTTHQAGDRTPGHARDEQLKRYLHLVAQRNRAAGPLRGVPCAGGFDLQVAGLAAFALPLNRIKRAAQERQRLVNGQRWRLGQLDDASGPLAEFPSDRRFEGKAPLHGFVLGR